MSAERKVVLVTGANGGLGQSVTERFLAEGATVVGSSLSIKPADFSGPLFTAIAADLSNSTAVRELVASVVTRSGKIDVLAHLVGGFAGGPSVADTDDKTWEQMISMNLTSTFNVIRAVLPYMRKANYGRVIAVGSLTATEPHAGLGAYVVTKSAMAMLLRTVAMENSDANITANVVLPGTMDTPSNRANMPNADFSKWVAPKDVASLVYWLSTDEASQITGALVPLPGHS